jgi:hypothetical protein
MRRGMTVVATALALAVLPAAAWAQDAEPQDAEQDEVGIGGGAAATRETQQEPQDEVGIGEADAVECRGTVTATVVDLDGAPVAGAVVSVAGQQVASGGAVDSLCGEVAASLLVAPDGYAPAGPTEQVAQVRQATTTTVTFTVDPVEVLGTQFEQPAEAPPAAAPPAPTSDDAEAAPDDEVAAPELAATGPEDAPTLVLIALLCGLLGTMLLALTPAPVRVGRD